MACISLIGRVSAPGFVAIDAENRYIHYRDAKRIVTQMMNAAIFVASPNKPPVNYHEIVSNGNSTTALKISLHFWKKFHLAVPFAQAISALIFAEFFCELIKARAAYFADYKKRS